MCVSIRRPPLCDDGGPRMITDPGNKRETMPGLIKLIVCGARKCRGEGRTDRVRDFIFTGLGLKRRPSLLIVGLDPQCKKKGDLLFMLPLI